MDWRPIDFLWNSLRHPRARIRSRHPPPPARADRARGAEADPARLRHPCRPARRAPAAHRRARDRARADRQPERRGGDPQRPRADRRSTSRGARRRRPDPPAARRRARPRPLRPRRADAGAGEQRRSARCSARARPVRLDLGGDGSWTRWPARRGSTSPGRRTAELALGMDDAAASALRGWAAPAPFLRGKLQRLTAPRVLVNGSGLFADRRRRRAAVAALALAPGRERAASSISAAAATTNVADRRRAAPARRPCSAT